MTQTNAPTPQDLWTSVSRFMDALFPNDPALEAALRESGAAGLPNISITAAEGRLLSLLARNQGAKRILEIGTLGGYSAIWLARALPDDGLLVTLEMDTRHAEVARRNIFRAELSNRVDIRVGPALETLPVLTKEFPDGFDLIFIDADKKSYPDYWRWAMRLSHRGTLIIADNVVRDGKVADVTNEDPDAVAVRSYLALVAGEPRVHATVMQTVGSKGYDGMSLALVL